MLVPKIRILSGAILSLLESKKQSRYRPGVAQRKLRFPDFMTTVQDGGKVVSLTTGRLYPKGIHLVLISVSLRD